jgi:hypothetical protein
MNAASHAFDWMLNSGRQPHHVAVDPGVISLEPLSQQDLRTRFITREVVMSAVSLAVIGLCMMAVLSA